jgi:hypothetical protein
LRHMRVHTIRTALGVATALQAQVGEMGMHMPAAARETMESLL